MVLQSSSINGDPPVLMERRRFLRLLGMSAAGALAACGGSETETGRAPGTLAASGAPGTAAEDVPRVRLLGQAASSEEPAIRKFADEFDAASVQVDFQPWDTLMPKIQADLAAGTPTFDIFHSDIEFAYTIWPDLLPLNELIEEAAYPLDGFFPNVLAYGDGLGGQEGVRFSLPITADTQLAWYRTDEVDEFPDNWAAFESLLREFTGGGRYALAVPGVPAQQVARFLVRYWSIEGARLLSEDWRPLISGDEGVSALEMYVRQVQQFAPPGVQAWELTDAGNAFFQGDAVVCENWPEIMLPGLTDPSKSTIGENWMPAAFPEGGTGNLTQHSLMIMKSTSNPDAAFDFVAHCTAPEQAERQITEFRSDSARQEVWGEVHDDDPALRKFFPVWGEQMALARPFAPGLPQWLELFIALGEGVSKAMAGERTAKEALDEVAETWTRAIAQARPEFPYQEFVA